MRRNHVAIIDSQTADELLAHRKRIETRFYRSKRAPWDRVQRGDRVHFKVAGGDVVGAWRVTRVRQIEELRPQGMRRLRHAYADAVRAPGGYWAARRSARYGILIWIQPVATRKPVPQPDRQFGNGWVILPD